LRDLKVAIWAALGRRSWWSLLAEDLLILLPVVSGSKTEDRETKTRKKGETPKENQKKLTTAAAV
jgi:hypothetical protein